MKPDEGEEEQGNTGDTEHGTPGTSVDPEDEDEEGDVDFNPFLRRSHLEKQTVKLAPGLPSLKLPPSVHVMSQCNVGDLQAFGLL
jgi:hypothetical protein